MHVKIREILSSFIPLTKPVLKLHSVSVRSLMAEIPHPQGAAGKGRSMVNTRGLARLGILAVGLGIGAGWAHTPVASADTSSDLLSSIDSLLGGGGLSALSDPLGLNLAISIDGQSLVSDGSAVAHSGTGDIAIAFGADSTANAEGGTGDYALADGTNALANAGGTASDTGANNDSAIDIGNNPVGTVGAPDGAYAGNADLIGNTSGGTGTGDTAIDIGNNGVDTAALDGGNTGAFAGAGGLIGASGDGNSDTAINFGNDNGFGDGPAAVDGTSDFASQSGDSTGTNLGAFAGFGNDDIASVLGANSSASAGEGNSDIAYVLDLLGTTGSNANAGFSGSSDLAAVLGIDGVTANAVNGDDLTTILPALSAEATTGSSFLADLLPSLGESAASSGSNFLADLASLF